MAATATDMTIITAAGAIGVRVGKVLSRHNMAKHFILTITDGKFNFARDQANIDAEAALDGIYIIRTCVPEISVDAATVIVT